MFNKISHRKKLILLLAMAMLTLTLAACTAQGAGDFASVPAGRAYAEGKEIFFSHTEASDADIAATLSDMMKSPVLWVSEIFPDVVKLPPVWLKSPVTLRLPAPPTVPPERLRVGRLAAVLKFTVPPAILVVLTL